LGGEKSGRGCVYIERERGVRLLELGGIKGVLKLESKREVGNLSF
jgi:hypothetical protein